MQRQLTSRRRAQWVAVAAVVVLAAAGCPDKNGEDTGVDGGDVADAADTSADSDGASDSGGSPDTSQDTGPPGKPVSVRSFGVFPPIAAECGAPNERQRIPFYFTTRDGNQIRPVRAGDLLNGERIVPNRTVSAGSLTTRRTRVAEMSRTSCASGGSCSSPFKCGTSGMAGAAKRCTRQTGVEFIPGSARQDYRPNFSDDSGQIVTILLENTAGWNGFLTNLVGTKYDEDGNADFSKKEGRATDPDGERKEAIRFFSRSLATATSPDNTKVSMWYFGGTNRIQGARPMINARGDDHYTDALERPKGLLGSLPSPPREPANVYQALLRVANKDFGLSKYEDHEKFLVLITDGPNEVYDKSATRQKVFNKLKNMGIHLFVIHLDAQIDPSLLRDDPRYWAGTKDCREDSSCQGALPCNSDSDCANFETCRKATLYADNPGGDVGETAQEYCLPDYSDGHLGPVAAYSDLACATNGNYLYTTEPEQMRYYARRIPYLFDGQWSVEAEISAFNDKVGLEDGFYRFSGAIMGLLSPNLAQVFSLPTRTGKFNHLRDSRPVLRKGIVPGED